MHALEIQVRDQKRSHGNHEIGGEFRGEEKKKMWAQDKTQKLE